MQAYECDPVGASQLHHQRIADERVAEAALEQLELAERCAGAAPLQQRAQVALAPEPRELCVQSEKLCADH